MTAIYTSMRSPGGAAIYGGMGASAAPSAPSGVAGSATGGTSITITWVDTSGDETGFDVQIESPSGSANWVTASGATNPTAAGVQTFAVTGLTDATSYTPRVRSFNGVGPSAWAVGAAVITDNTGSGGGEIPPIVSPLTDTEMRELHTWMRELHLIHGLQSGSPLRVDQSGQRRTAGTITQRIGNASSTVTVERID